MLTLEEFAAAVAARPLDEIPVEHDTEAIISAEFVALAFRRMGMLPNVRRRLSWSRGTLEHEYGAGAIAAPGSPILRRKAPGTATCGGDELQVPHASVHHFLPSAFSSLQTSPPLVFAGGRLTAERLLLLPRVSQSEREA